MKENFSIVVESYHIADRGEQENVRRVLNETNNFMYIRYAFPNALFFLSLLRQLKRSHAI